MASVRTGSELLCARQPWELGGRFEERELTLTAKAEVGLLEDVGDLKTSLWGASG